MIQEHAARDDDRSCYGDNDDNECEERFVMPTNCLDRCGVSVCFACIVGIGLLTILLCAETIARRMCPESLLRPSISFGRAAEHSEWFFEHVGYYVAMCTDVFYILREILKEDLMNILSASSALLFSVFYFFKGYEIYFRAAVSDAYAQYSTTPLVLGIIGTSIVAASVGFFVWWIDRRKGIWERIRKRLARPA